MNQHYYIVHKTPKGWRTYLSFEFVTLAEAKSALERCGYIGVPRYDLAISRKMPASIGCGWTSLNTEDLVNIGDLA